MSTATLAPAGQTIAVDVQPFVVEAYYKVRWGSAGEFIRLFKKNHLPILRQQMAEGRILSLKAESPFHHATEDGRWDLRVTITRRNAVVAHDDYDGAALVRRLFPDEATFRREEQHRFELLLSHWDLVITPVDLGRP
ncbi:hypothetical protein ABE85_19375 [Mitsuaria sp. 7]|nr:hypothetical protein ABE85_19375 [Mitsuaria sp. 7]